jgi:NAD(P)-dependent dehydrogenase (short-subunit alcohol dehydrogenase family)
MPRLSDRPVLVTGAAGAIGAAVCRAILDAGGAVIGCDLAPGRHVAHVFDVTREDGWRTAIDRIAASADGLAGLVNTAGVFVRGTVAETDPATFARVLAVNLDGTFLGCRHAMPLLARHGGSIVNLSSIFGRVGRHDVIAYATSKGGVDGLTRSVARHGARLRPPVRCNSISPAFVESPMLDATTAATGWPAGARARIRRDVPLGRFGTPEEVATLAVYLLSDDSGCATGADFALDGGYTAR